MKRHINMNMRIVPFSRDFYELQLMWKKAKSLSQITINSRKGCWIKYQLNLRKITQEMVAARAGVSQKMVSHVITGRKSSDKVKKALAETLGYPSFEALLAASRGHDGGTV